MAALADQILAVMRPDLELELAAVDRDQFGLDADGEAELIAVDGRKLEFKVSAHDGKDLIGEGRHERVVVGWERFNAKVAEKAKAAEAVS